MAHHRPLSSIDRQNIDDGKVGLNTAAKAAGKLYFGTAVDNRYLNTGNYTAINSNTADFGQITPANSMKWESTEPQQNKFTYTGGDIIADMAKKNGQLLRCHTLVWHSQLPNWVKTGSHNNATLIAIMKNHITNVMKHYKGKCYAWDVVNEAFDDKPGNNYRSESIFYKTIGEAYIPIAFAAAAAADPDVKLYYNDYNIEDMNKKFERTKTVVEQIKAYPGARIDGVGMQTHLQESKPLSEAAITAVMNKFASMDLDVAITELDVRLQTKGANAQARQQRNSIYGNVVRACKNVKRCVGITIWDFTDKYSWVPETFKGEGEALPWDANLKKKDDLYDAILKAWGPASS
ncbi:glycoside hydrolase [Microthyrium microscopicum]|uniref:Beta-xylanase n=1 Tax=Microthyrium microscopicum TaxID=703497 RepID=A0A6A6UD08_9PEZI|nr:glycoside hydrolase [Microthyrium microscopicum]